MNTKETNYRKILIRFALPMMLSMITQQLYSAVDMAIVGRYLGIDELAAVGNTTTVIAILIALSGGLELGSEVVFAKYKGAQDVKAISTGIKNILLFTLGGAILLTSIGLLLMNPLIQVLQVPKTLIELTIAYYRVFLLGLIGLFVYDLSRSLLIALGYPGLATALVLITSVINIILDLVFICVFRMGVTGAALATIIAQYIGMVSALLLLYTKTKEYHIKIRKGFIQWSQIKEILSVALPNAMQQLILSLSAVLLIGLVNPFGSAVISGYLAVNKLLLFGILPVIGMSQALSVFSASNYGAGDIGLIKAGHKFISQAATAFTLAVIVCNFLFPGILIGFFINIKENPEAYQFAKSFLQLSSVACLFGSLKNVNESLLRGCMKMKAYLLSNLSDITIRTIATYLLIESISKHSFWAGNTIAKGCSLVISIIAVRMFFTKERGRAEVKK